VRLVERTNEISGLNKLDDLWSWNGQRWEQRFSDGQQTTPGRRSAFSAAYDEARQTVVLFGGTGAGTDSAVWELKSVGSATPGVIVTFDWFQAQVDAKDITHLEIRGVAGAQAHASGVRLGVWSSAIGAWVPMMRNTSGPTSPTAIAAEVWNGFSTYITDEQYMYVVFSPNEWGSDIAPQPETSVEGVELTVNYSYAD